MLCAVVPGWDCLARRVQIWMLTGDKIETAINIGFACSLLTDEQILHTVKSSTPAIEEASRLQSRGGWQPFRIYPLGVGPRGHPYIQPPSFSSSLQRRIATIALPAAAASNAGRTAPRTQGGGQGVREGGGPAAGRDLSRGRHWRHRARLLLGVVLSAFWNTGISQLELPQWTTREG